MTTTRYAKSGELNLAYQVLGDGPRDLVYVPGWISNIEVMWEDPVMASLLEGLASFSRLVLFDKRGTGLSDPIPLDRIATLEERMDDVRAVMDAIDSTSATLLGHSEGGNMCSLFAATYPDRTDALILVSSYAKRIPSPDYPWAPDPAERRSETDFVEQHFGDPEYLPTWTAPSRIHDEAFRRWVAKYFRMGSSPSAAAHLMRMNTQMDTTGVLASIRVPTLCLYRKEDNEVTVEEGRWIAGQIPDAKFVELPGADHLMNGSDVADILAEIEEFVTGARSERMSHRSLATVLFVDIVDSTTRAAELGDRAWSHLLHRQRAMVTTEVERFRGVVIDARGDEAVATFDGPARAIRCAQSIVTEVRRLGLEVRTGLHTGEIESVDGRIAGLAVHIGARIVALADPGDVMVSRTVKDLVVGSGFEFVQRGTHVLKGVPDEWPVFSVV